MTKRSLEAIKRRRGDDEPVGQIMIGYSDSNKDGGIVASLISLRRAQSTLTEVGNRHGVRVRFFHGRGGTISRGAGPTHRFIKSLPDHTLRGDLRLTEQGETIAQKYAHQPTAIYTWNCFLRVPFASRSLIRKNLTQSTRLKRPWIDWRLGRVTSTHVFCTAMDLCTSSVKQRRLMRLSKAVSVQDLRGDPDRRL